MSENYLKLIPNNPQFVPAEDAQIQVVNLLERLLPYADERSVWVTSEIAFVDPGGNLNAVYCPNCGSELLASGWWQQAMDKAYANRFRDLSVQMPCCGTALSLDNLRYEWPAGFARSWIEIRNPGVIELTARQIKKIEKAFGCPLRVIWSHI